jgi:FMN hydrolase / 5-amino-6-(5-phospho-D-ribitylamino)uracil phosphatase
MRHVNSVGQVDRIRRIKAISFDGDMTLWDFEAVMRHSLAQALAELRKHLPSVNAAELTVDRMIEIRNTAAEELRGESVLERIRLEAFVRTLRSVGNDNHELAGHLNSVYLKHRFEDIELYPDVSPALDSLAARYVLGLVSNGNSYPERCGLQDRFTFVVLAQDLGVEKPHPALFWAACKKARCTPDELMHVGDSLSSDVRGATGVGAVAVWLNRSRRPRDPKVAADFEIHSLTELQALLN